jgi:hypothetical protein
MTASCTFRDQNDCFLIPRANSASWYVSKKMSRQLFCWVNGQLNGKGLNWLTEYRFRDYFVVFPQWRTKMTASCTLRDQNDCFPNRIIFRPVCTNFKFLWLFLFTFFSSNLPVIIIRVFDSHNRRLKVCNCLPNEWLQKDRTYMFLPNDNLFRYFQHVFLIL